MYHWGDGRKYDGRWENGVQHGEGLFYDTDGNAKKGLWENGKRLKWIETK